MCTSLCLDFQDVIVAILLAVGYFCGGVPLAVHADDWKFWRERATDNDTRRYNLDAIVSSAQATAVSSNQQTSLGLTTSSVKQIF